MIGIIDYGMSNLKSVLNAFSYLNHSAKIIDSPLQLKGVDKIVLPGVGAFGQAIERLTNSGFEEAIKEYVLIKKIPFLGICLGMQLMFDSSTEKGFHKGMGLIKGDVKFLGDKIKDKPIPHVGWNTVTIVNKESKLMNNLPGNDFYFVHSFYCDSKDKTQICASVDYGFCFDVGIEFENIFAVQFHPEKSQRNGLKLFGNFATL